MANLEYEFEELPLITDLGFAIAPVNGSAEISYHSDGEWSVQTIWLEGCKGLTLEQRFENVRRVGTGAELHRPTYKPVELCRKSYPWLFDAIIHQLERGRFGSAIDDAVADANDEARERRGSRHLQEA